MSKGEGGFCLFVCITFCHGSFVFFISLFFHVLDSLVMSALIMSVVVAEWEMGLRRYIGLVAVSSSLRCFVVHCCEEEEEDQGKEEGKEEGKGGEKGRAGGGTLLVDEDEFVRKVSTYRSILYFCLLGLKC